MPIVISHGGANFDNIGSEIAGIALAAKRQKLDEQRYDLLKSRVEQEMDFAAEEEKRRKEEAERAKRARETTPGVIEGMTRAPFGPPDPNASESQQFEASIRAQMERMGKIAAKIAETDPERGLEYAQRFLEEGQKDLHRLAADRGISEMMREIGEGMTTPGTYGPMQFGDQAVEDPVYQETMKGVLQELQTAQGPEVTPEQKLQALQNANKTRQQVRKDLTRRNEQNASTAAARETIMTRAAEGGARLTTAQKGKLGALSANIGFEEGMVTPDKVDAEVERILRGTVMVPNPFSFGEGGDMLEMTPESAAKFQETLARIQKLQAEQGSVSALEQQRRASAKLSEKRGLELPRPRGESGKPNAILDRSRATNIAKTELGDSAKPGDIKRRADEIMRQGVNGNGVAAKDTLREEIRAGKLKSRAEVEARAKELGVQLR